jgi:serine/threonine-protein kinase
MRRLASRYVLHELLGRGTSGDVWRGVRIDDNTEIAIKLLRPELAGDPDAVDWFLREYSVLVELDAPNLVHVHDLVVDDEDTAIVMDLVEGLDLRSCLREYGPTPPSRAVDLAVGVLDALAHAHAAGIVHCDVKPENILVEPLEPGVVQARLTDFGIATLACSPTVNGLTGPVGTPTYMAPELAEHASPTPAADIYATGVVLYEMLRGKPPFDVTDPAEVARAHREAGPPPIAGLPPALADVLGTLLATSPRSRPPSARAAAEALLDAAREDSRDHDLDVELDRATDELVGLGSHRADNDHTLLTATRRVAAAPGRPAPAPAPAAAGFWTAGGGGFVTPAPDNDSTVVSSRLDGPPLHHDDVSQTMISPSLIDPADAATGPVPYVPRAEQVGEPDGGASGDGDPRRRTWLVAAATTAVLLVAGLGGWALASSPGGSGSDTEGAQVARPGTERDSGLDTSGFPTDLMGTATTGMTGAQNSQPISAPIASAQPTGTPTGVPPTDGPAPTPTPSPTRGAVPGVVGKSVAIARKAITDAGFGEPNTTMGCRAGSQAGAVYGQNPDAGRMVALSMVIQLEVQKNDCALLPDVTGNLVTTALTTVRNAGFNVSATPATCPYGTGTVRSMWPWGGMSQSKSDPVTLSVSCPDPPTPPPTPVR